MGGLAPLGEDLWLWVTNKSGLTSPLSTWHWEVPQLIINNNSQQTFVSLRKNHLETCREQKEELFNLNNCIWDCFSNSMTLGLCYLTCWSLFSILVKWRIILTSKELWEVWINSCINSSLHILLFSCSVVSDFLRLHGLQHARPPCPPPTPRAWTDSCPLSQWCHTIISSSVLSFSSCPQSFLASRSFPISWLFISGGQSIGASASASVLPMNIQDSFLLGLTSLMSLQFKGLSKGFSNSTVQKYQFFSAQLSFWSNSHIHTWLLEKP